jgi:hypothetical protein
MNKTDQTLLSAVPVYQLAPSFPVYFHEDELRVSTWYFLSPSGRE